MLLFLNMSGGEIFLILLFVLMFFGASSIPVMARTLGRGFRQIKDAAQQVQEEIKKSANEAEKGTSESIDSKSHAETLTKEFKDMQKNVEE